MNDIDKMVDDHKRLINYEASKYSGFVPLSVVTAEAYKLAYKAARNYDPKSEAKFSTHLTNQLKKLSRISTQFGSTVRLPENKQFKQQRLHNISLQLKEELGREPSVQELADATGMHIKEINFLLQNRRQDVSVGNLLFSPLFVSNSANDDWLSLVYHDLSNTDKVIFEYKTGFGGKSKLSNEEIAKKLHISASTISNRAKIIADKIGEGWD